MNFTRTYLYTKTIPIFLGSANIWHTGLVMVYSVADKDSFDDAILTLYELRKNEDSQRAAVILVANKTDMVRNREVDEEGEFQYHGLFH